MGWWSDLPDVADHLARDVGRAQRADRRVGLGLSSAGRGWCERPSRRGVDAAALGAGGLLQSGVHGQQPLTTDTCSATGCVNTTTVVCTNNNVCDGLRDLRAGDRRVPSSSTTNCVDSNPCTKNLSTPWPDAAIRRSRIRSAVMTTLSATARRCATGVVPASQERRRRRRPQAIRACAGQRATRRSTIFSSRREPAATMGKRVHDGKHVQRRRGVYGKHVRRAGRHLRRRWQRLQRQ